MPVIPLQFGDTGLAGRRPIGPVLQLNSTASNSVGKVPRNGHLRQVIAKYTPISHKYRTFAKMLNDRHVMTDKKNRTPFYGGYTVHLPNTFILKLGISNS